MLRAAEIITALYCSLSQEDSLERESNSVTILVIYDINTQFYRKALDSLLNRVPCLFLPCSLFCSQSAGGNRSVSLIGTVTALA